jgi:hypothetical protein
MMFDKMVTDAKSDWLCVAIEVVAQSGRNTPCPEQGKDYVVREWP